MGNVSGEIRFGGEHDVALQRMRAVRELRHHPEFAAQLHGGVDRIHVLDDGRVDVVCCFPGLLLGVECLAPDICVDGIAIRWRSPATVATCCLLCLLLALGFLLEAPDRLFDRKLDAVGAAESRLVVEIGRLVRACCVEPWKRKNAADRLCGLGGANPALVFFGDPRLALAGHPVIITRDDDAGAGI